jgi:hypothetical protein
MTSSRFFAGASTSGADADAKDGAPTPRERAYLLVRDLVKDIRRERHERRLERTEEDGRKVDDGDDRGKDEIEPVTCAICLDVPRVPAVLRGDDEGAAEGCASTAKHVFCLDCVDRWSKVCNACPLCKARFHAVVWQSPSDGTERRRVVAPKQISVLHEDETAAVLAEALERIENALCEMCGGGDCEERILLCDACDAGCHTWCCAPPLRAVPEGDWFCPACDGEDALVEAELRAAGKDTHSINVRGGGVSERAGLSGLSEELMDEEAFHGVDASSFPRAAAWRRRRDYVRLLFGRRKRTNPPLDPGNIASRGDDETETDAADVSFERFRFARRGAEDVL